MHLEKSKPPDIQWVHNNGPKGLGQGLSPLTAQTKAQAKARPMTWPNIINTL